jgi:hypothetical protein
VGCVIERDGQLEMRMRMRQRVGARFLLFVAPSIGGGRTYDRCGRAIIYCSKPTFSYFTWASFYLPRRFVRTLDNLRIGNIMSAMLEPSNFIPPYSLVLNKLQVAALLISRSQWIIINIYGRVVSFYYLLRIIINSLFSF